MNETGNTSYTNASLTQFVDADDESNDTNEDERDDDHPDESNDVQNSLPLTIDAIDDPHVRALAQELADEELTALVDHMFEDRDILDAVQEACDNEQLLNNIDEITEHYAERPSLVEAASEYIAEQFGMRPFELTITEPDNEYIDPMIQLDVDENVVFTNNPDLNAELLSHATRMVGVTQSGQKRLFGDWRDAIGGERVVEFKEERDPDALGFAVPGQIPATGDKPGRTPITKIPYIGEATAEDLHPSGELMSIEDYQELTEKQRAWIDLPIDNTDYDTRKARGIATGFAEHVTEDVTDVLGKALNMIDRRDSDGDMAWVNPANAFGLTADDTVYTRSETTSVKTVDETDDHIIIETTTGAESKYAPEYWKMLEAVADAVDTEIEAGENTPAFVGLPDDGYMIAAPISSE